tara:strand:- start:472 stop:804 length:333 start_codon:yes stop_codon:yes gene_type:complete
MNPFEKIEHEVRFGARIPIDEELPRWDAELGKMKGSVKNKARKLNRLKKIRECATENNYIIEPIEGYNKTVYLVGLNPETCNCQFNKNGKGKTCAHIMAVHLYRKLRGEK